MLRPLVLLDSIAEIGGRGSSSANAGVVSGSHGGRSAAGFVLDHPHKPYAVFFNDAGIGKDRAGIVGLDLLQTIGVACCAYSHESARIGEAADGLANGVLTHCNARANHLGLRPGLTVAEALRIIGVGAP
jgi:hypothetical protein